MPVQNYIIIIDWEIEYNLDISNKIDAYNHIIELLKINDDMRSNWYSVFENIYNLKSNNFDGYIQKVYYENKKLYIEFYLMDDKLSNFKNIYLDNWKEQQTINIIDAVKNHMKKFSYFEDNKLIGSILVKEIELRELT
jgi:hypothetical protein